MSAVINEPAPTFRSMRSDDLDTVMDIEARAHAFPWTPGIFRDCLRVGYCCWLLQRGSRVDGYGIMSVGAGESHLLNLCVRDIAQGEGLGRLMLDHMVEIARQHGCETMLLEVRPSNPVAINLYHSAGFHEVGSRTGYYPSHSGREDALILAQALL